MLVLYIFLTILITLALGIPIAFSLGVTALGFLITLSDIPLTVLIQRMYLGVNSFPLLAIPLFMLAGSIMNRGGISKRLVEFSMAMVGQIKGGLAMVTIVTSMFFGAITGTSAGASAAIGQILIPAMIKYGYPPGFAAAVTSAGSSLGIVIPPSVPMILYGSISGISVATLFLSGVPLGVSIGIFLMIGCYIITARLESKGLYTNFQQKFSASLLMKSFISAIPALCLPIIILGGIMTGIVTPTESAALAVFAGAIIGGLIYKELSIKDIINSLNDSVKGSAVVMFIVATASILGYAFTTLGIGKMFMEPLLAFADNQIMLMLICSLVLFIGGFIFDGTVMVLILVPLFMPLVNALSIDSLQFALLTIVVWCIGQQTPPVASGLYVTCALAKVSMIEASKYNLLLILIFVIFLFAIIFIPDVVLYLPRLLSGQIY